MCHFRQGTRQGVIAPEGHPGPSFHGRKAKINQTMDKRSTQYRKGMGNWEAWGDDVEPVFRAAEKWADALKGGARLWLCWHVDADCCLLQQRLVKNTGWTAVAGFDPRVGVPENMVQGSVVVDFNAGLDLPVLYPHYPLEFALLFVDRIAFWHWDLLLPEPKMREIVQLFASLPEGTSAAVCTLVWRDFFSLHDRRFWALIGCTKRSARRDQYKKGCGWSLNFQSHRNRAFNAGNRHLPNYCLDHGSGIYCCKRRHGGKVLALKKKEKGFSARHFSLIKFEGYKRVSASNDFRDLSRDLSGSFRLCDCARKVGVAHLLQAGGADK